MAPPQAQPFVPVVVRHAEGPGHGGVIDSTACWGAWFQLQGVGTVGLQVAWTGHVTPLLHVMDETGQPRYPAAPIAFHRQRFFVELPPGLTYIAIQNVAPSPQSIRIATQRPVFSTPPPGVPMAGGPMGAAPGTPGAAIPRAS